MNETVLTTKGSGSLKSTRRLLWLALFTLPLVLLVVVVFLRHSPLKVSVSFLGFQTNADGEVTSRVEIHNQSKQPVEFGYGVQIRVDQGWAHTNGDIQQFFLFKPENPILKPGDKREMIIAPPQSGAKWRVVAMCRRLLPGEQAFAAKQGGWVEFDGSAIDPPDIPPK
jgi:hypothetical protein